MSTIVNENQPSSSSQPDLIAFNIQTGNRQVCVSKVGRHWTVRQLKSHLISQQITNKKEDAQILRYCNTRLVDCFTLSQLFPPLHAESVLSLSLSRASMGRNFLRDRTMITEQNTREMNDLTQRLRSLTTSFQVRAAEQCVSSAQQMLQTLQSCSANNETVAHTIRAICGVDDQGDDLMSIMKELLTMPEVIVMAQGDLRPLDRIRATVRSYYSQNQSSISVHTAILVRGFSQVFERQFLSDKLLNLLTSEARLANQEGEGVFAKAAASVLKAHSAKLFSHFLDASQTPLSKNIYHWIKNVSQALAQSFSSLLKNGRKDFDKIRPLCRSMEVPSYPLLEHPVMAKIAEYLLETA